MDPAYADGREEGLLEGFGNGVEAALQIVRRYRETATILSDAPYMLTRLQEELEELQK